MPVHNRIMLEIVGFHVATTGSHRWGDILWAGAVAIENDDLFANCDPLLFLSAFYKCPKALLVKTCVVTLELKSFPHV